VWAVLFLGDPVPSPQETVREVKMHTMKISVVLIDIAGMQRGPVTVKFYDAVQT
jgi:predicted ThiF/HesA family dinucleotide-utilizing enzyme